MLYRKVAKQVRVAHSMRKMKRRLSSIREINIFNNKNNIQKNLKKEAINMFLLCMSIIVMESS